MAWRRRDDINRLYLGYYELASMARRLYRKIWYLMGPLFFVVLILNPNWGTAIQIVIGSAMILVLDLMLTFFRWLFLSFVDKDQRPQN